MIGLLKAEFRKITSTRTTLVLLAGSIFLTLLYVVMYAQLAGYTSRGRMTLPPLTSEASVRMVYAAIGTGYIIVLIMGIIGYTNEYRHHTATMTFLATPHRWRVIAAKFITNGVTGIVVAIINIVIALPVATFLINSKDHFSIPSSDIQALIIGDIIAFFLMSIMGVAVGALIRNQVAAVVGALIWVMVVERIFTVILPDIGKWMPVGAADALLQSRSLDGSKYLEPVQGGFLLLAYALVFAVVAAATSNRRDIS